MSKKEKLLRKLFQKKTPRDFSKKELDQLMSMCGCVKEPGGRGSGIRYVHADTGRVLAFDEPHGGDNLYAYHVKSVRKYINDIGEEQGGTDEKGN